RVRETAEVLAGLEARVTTRIYPGMGHTVNEDEIEAAAEIVRSLLAGPDAP
ncbi:MAG: phospholipase, partial [Gemmatimonadota bacterium]|nr:phospholipase [Gemmatimonadota bacterium]